MIRQILQQFHFFVLFELRLFTILFRKKVADLELALSDEQTAMQRGGLVLSSIMILKQICNHHDQFMDQTACDRVESRKFEIPF